MGYSNVYQSSFKSDYGHSRGIILVMGLLTDKKIKNLKPRDKQYRVNDGLGLYITIKPRGAKLWHYRYHIYDNSKTSKYREKILSLGQYPLVSLSQARADHTLARADVVAGKDVAQEKKIEKYKVKSSKVSFKSVAEDWFSTWSATKESGTINAVRGRLENYIYPFKQNLLITDIQYPVIKNYIKKIYLSNTEKGGIETARRCIFIINMIMYQAVYNGIIAENPLARLLKEFPKQKVVNQSAITDIEEYGKFAYEMDSVPHLSGYCIRLLMHTAIREGAMLNMKWSNIDFKKKQIIYTDTKVNREHIVPLSKQAIEILKQIQEHTAHQELIFYSPSSASGHISPQAMLKQIRSRGWSGDAVTVHGFRASFQTICEEEELETNVAILEMCLNHAVKGALSDIYRRGKFIKQRTVLMQKWSDYIDELKRNYIKSSIIKTV